MQDGADALARACVDRMLVDDNATRTLGITLGEVGPGRAEMSMVVREDMLNCHGTCHGGFIFALADAAFGYACNARNQRAVAQSASIVFVSPAFAGQVLTARARELSRRGRSGIYDVTVTNEAGEVVAELRGQSRTIAGTHLP